MGLFLSREVLGTDVSHMTVTFSVVFPSMLVLFIAPALFSKAAMMMNWACCPDFVPFSCFNTHFEDTRTFIVYEAYFYLIPRKRVRVEGF